jgi:hypothetical protein
MTDRFDWNADPTVVVRSQAAIAIHGDEGGGVMLRQEGQFCLSEDQFIDVARENVLTVCTTMLREAGLHHYSIVHASAISIVGRDGNEMKIPASELERIDRISHDMRADERRPRKDPKGAERKRRQRAKQRDTADVTPVTCRDIVTDRDTITTAPRLPAELDLLQNGGTKQPALTR